MWCLWFKLLLYAVVKTSSSSTMFRFINNKITKTSLNFLFIVVMIGCVSLIDM